MFLSVEDSSKSGMGLGLQDASGRGRVAVLVRNPAARRLLEGLASRLDLVVAPAGRDTRLDFEAFAEAEVVIADEDIALLVRDQWKEREGDYDRVNPALIAVRERSQQVPSTVSADDERLQGFESLLVLPQDPGLILAQLSVALYAYRAFVHRYQLAFDELYLNRRIFRSVTSGISVASATEPDMPLVYVNPAFELMTGYTLEEVQGKNCRFLQGRERDQAGLAAVREALEGRREVVAVLRNYRKDGSSFWNELSLSPIRSRTGEVTHIVGIQQDVTARVEFEAALRESEKLAAVGRLAASIAHEINNPLESVTNLIYLARNAASRADMESYLEQADAELRRASQITNQSLRFYRQSTRPTESRLNDLVGAVLHLYESKITNAGLRVERGERASGTVLCLESEIRQVLTNLIRNAIDAMRPGGRLLIRTRAGRDYTSGLKGVVLTIADTGTGIPAEVRRNLYRAFFTTKGAFGTGLGLWVSSEIVKRHRGHLRVRSNATPGRSWTVFQLFLPYRIEGAELTGR